MSRLDFDVFLFGTAIFILFLKFNQVHYIRKNTDLGKRNPLV
jgi:hypothetical protein